MSERITMSTEELQALVRAAVVKALTQQSVSAPKRSGTAPTAKLLVAVCCGECINEGAKGALDALQNANFQLDQPEESEFKKRAQREGLIAQYDGVLLPSVGDDDAAKMALGIFDEPVARLALTALAAGKPVWMAIHSPYEAQLKKNAPVLARTWDAHRRTLESFGFVVADYAKLAETVSGNFGKVTVATATGNAGSGKRALISVSEVEAAAKNGASIKLPQGAIVTPLARDRARELNVRIN